MVMLIKEVIYFMREIYSLFLANAEGHLNVFEKKMVLYIQLLIKNFLRFLIGINFRFRSNNLN